MAKPKRPSTAQKPTNARDIANMNEAQLEAEIRKTQRALDRATMDRVKYGGITAPEREMGEAFPLGAGGMNRRDAERFTGAAAERAAKRASRLADAIKRQETEQKRLDSLNRALDQVKGTGKTLAQIREERRTATKPESTMHWKTTQKGEYSGAGYKPRVIESGAYRISGTQGAYRVSYNGRELGIFGSLGAAKEIAERHKRTH